MFAAAAIRLIPRLTSVRTPAVTRPAFLMRLRRRKRRLALLEYPDENGKVQGVEVWGISVLGDLKELGEKLSRRYR